MRLVYFNIKNYYISNIEGNNNINNNYNNIIVGYFFSICEGYSHVNVATSASYVYAFSICIIYDELIVFGLLLCSNIFSTDLIMK